MKRFFLIFAMFWGMNLTATLVTADDEVESIGKLKKGQALVEKARMRLREASEKPADAKLLRAHARDLYRQTLDIHLDLHAETKQELAAMGVVDPQDAATLRRRDKLRATYLQTDLLIAAIHEEMADTAAANSAEAKQDLTRAVQAYQRIYEKYRTRLAGLYARMYQARCESKLGNFNKAAGLLAELLEQPAGHPAFASLHRKVYLLAIDVWPNTDPPRHAEGIARTDAWLSKQNARDKRQHDVLKVFLGLGKLKWSYADKLTKLNSPENKVADLRRDAIANVEMAAAEKNAVQDEALRLLEQWRPSRGEPVDGEAAIDVFNRRIMPIFESERPSSCVQCHLAAVDLKNYILPSHEKTFVSLRDQGLIDTDRPENSKILTLISMGEKDLDTGARLIHEKTRNAEYEAFAAWITACCNDPAIRDLPTSAIADRAKPAKPIAVIRHTRKSRLLDSFTRNIWSQRMRCFPCHTPHEINANNARHQAAIKTQQEFARKYDDEFLNRLHFFRESPAATLRYLVQRSKDTPDGELPLINIQNPRDSLIVLKPLSKLPAKNADGQFEAPSYQPPISHMGGLKMHKDDHSYKAFVAWLRDYANTVGDRYANVEELPADNWQPSQLILKMTDAPEAWSVGTPVQLYLHRWDKAAESWEAEPIAFTQGTVTPRRVVNGALFFFGEKHDAAGRSVPKGDYLVKVYLDARGRIADDPALLLDDQDYQGQVVMRVSRWRTGFRDAQAISAARLSTE